MKLKKIICLVLSLLLAAAVMPVASLAGNGPSESFWDFDGEDPYYPAFLNIFPVDEYGEYIYENDEWVHYDIFSDNTVKNELAGAHYDRTTNTLTITDLDLPDCFLAANMMGEDFKLVVKGNCAIGSVYIYGDEWGGSLDIEGDGKLVVNGDRKYYDVFSFFPETSPTFKFIIGNDVTVEMHSSTKSENLVCINSIEGFNPEKGLIFSGKTPEYTAEQVELVKSVAGYYGEFDETWCGFVCTVEDDPGGVYGYETWYSYNELTDQYDLFSYIGVRRYVYSPTFDCYFPDHAYLEEYGDGYDIRFYSQEDFDNSIYKPLINLVGEPEELVLYKPCKSWSSLEWVYVDANGKEYIIYQDYINDTFTACEVLEIPEIEGEYVFNPLPEVDYTLLTKSTYLTDALNYYVKGRLLTVSPSVFSDVPGGKWYTNAVLYCNENGYMSGTGDRTFSPNDTLTRAMFVQILAKIAEADLDAYTKDTDGLPFTDVKASWYIKALKWAYEHNYTTGTSATTFGPNDPVTREQLAVFLRTFFQKNGIDVSRTVNITGYSDYSAISKWAREAMAWAVNVGLISGTTDTTLSPKNPATRAQVALIIMNYVEKVFSAE